MKTCGYKIIKEKNGEKCLVPTIENANVKINQNSKDESDFYIINEDTI